MKTFLIRLLKVLAVLLVVLAALVAVSIPSFVKARNTSCQNACIGNMRHIDSAKEQWAFEQKKEDGDPIDLQGVNEFIKGAVTPVCPGGGSYRYNAIGTDPECNITTPTRHAYAG